MSRAIDALTLEDATRAILVSFVQFGEEPSPEDERWAVANSNAETPDYHRAKRYAKAALGVL